MSEERLRIGDREREHAATALGEHFAQGRLTAEEHAERLDRIWAARTRADLTPVFRDLPDATYGPRSGPLSYPASTRATGRPGAAPAPWRRLPTPVLAVLVVLLSVAVLTHLPVILVGLLVWFLVVGRHRHRMHRW